MSSDASTFRKLARSTRAIFAFAWVAIAFSFSLQAFGEENKHRSLPDGGIVLWKIQPSEIGQSNIVKLFPWESLAALSSDTTGLDFSRITTASGMLGITDAPSWELAIRFSPSKTTDIGLLKATTFGPIRTSRSNPNIRLREWIAWGINVLQFNEHWMAGTEKSLKAMLSDEGKPHRLMHVLDVPDSVLTLVVDMEALKSKLDLILKDLERPLSAEEAALLGQCCDLLDYVVCSVELEGSTKIQIRWVPKDNSQTAECEKLVERVLKRCGEILVGIVRNEMDSDWDGSGERGKSVIAKYWSRVSGFLNEAIRKEIRNGEVITQLEEVEELVTLTSVVLSSLQLTNELGDVLPRPVTEQIMENLVNTMHNYEIVHRRLPPRAIKSSDGKPLLSWRVLLLPSLGEEELYRQFHLDEPWDSEHNKKLLESIPATYVNPNAELPLGYTTYLAPFGYEDRREQTIWDIDPLLLRQVSDGLGNTAAILEVEPKSAVPWTKPEDFDLQDRELIEFLGAPPAGGLVVMLDGRVYDLSDWKDKKRLKAVLTANGGEAVTAPF